MSEHYYTQNPSSLILEKHLEYTLREKTIKFVSVSGVFGFSTHVDNASQLLIEAFQPSGETVLDMGCGFGAIGLSLKSLFPNIQMTMCDINNRAVEYTKRNAILNKLTVNTLSSDLFSSFNGQLFDDIISNPPIASGKNTLVQMIDQAYEHLNPKGALWFVAFHNKGGSTLRGIMNQRFSNVQDMAKGGGIRVYKSIR